MRAEQLLKCEIFALKWLLYVLLIMEFSDVNGRILPSAKKQQNRKSTTTRKPFRILQELGQIFNPVRWIQEQQQQIQQISTESPENVIIDEPLLVQYTNSKTGQKEEYTTGDTNVDRTITSFFGTLTQIMDNMFKTFVTPAMNDTIWDDTPRPNGSGGLSNFLSSFFCQVFMGLLSPNYNGKRCFVYRYPSTTFRPRSANSTLPAYEDFYNP